MQIVIDIPDDVYRVLKEDIYPIPDTERLALVFKTLVKKGTPLPKNHGRLIDADELRKNWIFTRTEKIIIDDAPTILEAEVEYDD